MSYRRFQRGIRQMGGFAGGTSRLARPPAVLPEPDVKPADVATSGSFCIDIDGPVTIPDDGVRYVVPLDGSSVVASPVDDRFVFNGTDAISLPGPDGDLFAILDISADLTYTGGAVDEALAYMQLLDEDMVVYNEILLAFNADGSRHVTGPGLFDIYIVTAGFIRFRVENNSLSAAGPFDISGTFCFTWRIDE